MATATRTRAEQHRICNLLPTSDERTRTDWGFTDAVEAGVLEATVTVPSNIDLRRPWWRIGDQGRTGSCVGWATTDGVARGVFVAAGELAPDIRLSPRFTWMASKETDAINARPQTMIEGAGTTLKAAVDILRNYGAVPESLLPFDVDTTMYLGNENAFYAAAATHRIASYFNLQRNFANWRTWLAQHGPILVGLNVDAAWDNAASTGGKLDTYEPGTVRGGHAVAVVGYTDDERFILRNSWGTAWGDDGFAYASEQYIRSGFYNESYGVTI
jgi:hypothetical protein